MLVASAQDYEITKRNAAKKKSTVKTRESDRYTTICYCKRSASCSHFGFHIVTNFWFEKA